MRVMDGRRMPMPHARSNRPMRRTKSGATSPVHGIVVESSAIGVVSLMTPDRANTAARATCADHSEIRIAYQNVANISVEGKIDII